MRRALLLLFLFIFLCPLASGQLWKLRRYEIYGGLGTAQMFGDIGGYSNSENALGFKDIMISQTRFNIKTGMRYRVMEKVAFTFNLGYGLMHTSDNIGSNESRDYSSSISLFEPSLTAEYYFLKNNAESSYRFVKGDEIFTTFFAKLDAYLYAGLGPAFFSVKPDEDLSSSIVKDSGVALAFPMGFGVNYLLGPNSLVGVDFGIRYTTSDYIDGYTSQYSSFNDVYYFMTFVFTQKLKTSEKGLPTFRK